MSTSDRASLYAGVDVGEGSVHAALVRVDGGRCSIVSRHSGSSGDAGGVADFCSDALRVAVDAPGGLSVGAHLADMSVAPKFRRGRCSEIPVPGVPAVPWVTPSSWPEAPGWMRAGFGVWAALASVGLEVVETFPAAFFHALNGGRWPPPKTSVAGRSARLCLLAGLVELSGDCSQWGHDDIDAVACAVVAAVGTPAPHTCDRPDGSAMWLLPPGATR